MVFFLPSRAGGGRTGCPQSLLLELDPLGYPRAHYKHPVLPSPEHWHPTRGRQAVAGKKPPRTKRGMCTRAPPSRPAPGLSPLTRRKRCPYMGLFCSVTPARSPGRFRESPPPSSAGQGRGAGKGAGIFPGRRLSGYGKPQARVQSARGGRATLSWAQGSHPSALNRLAPESRRAHAPSVGSDPGGAQLQPRCCRRRQGNSRQEGRRPPASVPSRVPGQKLATARSGPVGAVVWASGRCRSLYAGPAPQQLKSVKADGC